MDITRRRVLQMGAAFAVLGTQGKAQATTASIFYRRNAGQIAAFLTERRPEELLNNAEITTSLRELTVDDASKFDKLPEEIGEDMVRHAKRGVEKLARILKDIEEGDITNKSDGEVRLANHLDGIKNPVIHDYIEGLARTAVESGEYPDIDTVREEIDQLVEDVSGQYGRNLEQIKSPEPLIEEARHVDGPKLDTI